MKSLAVRILGDFGVDGVEPQALGSRKARQALYILALGQGQAVPPAVLIDALWGDAPPARPEDQVAVLMSRLRAVLGRDRIEHRDAGYLLRFDWLDAAELTSLVTELERRRDAGTGASSAPAARVALSLVRGADPAAAAAAIPGHWAGLRVAELDRLAGRARLAAAAVLLDAGDWTGTIDAAAAALERDPYNEAALRLMLRGYVAGGQVAAALNAYATARQRLADELGTDPSPETAALHTAILRGELTAPAASPAPGGPTLPGLPGIVGRDAELQALADVADQAGDRRATEIVLVQGEAGIGKTTLLRAFAGQRAAAGDTVLTATCGQLDRSMPLDALLTALTGLLRRLGSEAGAQLLGGDRAVLGPMLGGGTAGAIRALPGYLPMLGDAMLGPAALYSALTRMLGRLASDAAPGSLVVIIDDAHLAGQALADWLRFVRRENIAVTVVAAARSGEARSIPADRTIWLGGLGRDAVSALVGPAHAEELYARSKGHPLFLSELAQQLAWPAASGSDAAPSAGLPASLVESVSARCDELGRAGTFLRTAAVIGQELDIDLLAAILARPVVDLLDDAEQAVARQFLVQDDGTFRFRHELLMQALAASASASRAALLHRQAGRVLARRADADPVTVARHARLGGDTELAAGALRNAAARAAERFDHAAAEALLDDALSLRAEPDGWLERARVRTRRGHYAAALEDVERAHTAGAAALEVGAWACYFSRRFAQAAQFAEDGVLAAGDRATRARCLAVGGRTRHASGDLALAEELLGEAFATAEGADRVTAAAWLGVLRSHQSRTAEALALLRPAARGQVGVEHTAATLHALLFTGHSKALAGQPASALEVFSRYAAEVSRRQVPRFAGRAENFSGWVLRNLGAVAAGLEHHQDALATARRNDAPETQIAALEDLAEQCLEDDDPGGAEVRLARARALIDGDLVFGWRLELKHALLRSRLALACGRAEQAAVEAADLEARATALGVPRYGCVARVLGQLAGHALGQPQDPAAVTAALADVEANVAIEAWRWSAFAATAFGNPALRDLAAAQVRRLAAQAGPHADELLAAAARRLG
ncbi:MAG TPA: AAA family ATPase [Streptosporangiaceae bacterium]